MVHAVPRLLDGLDYEAIPLPDLSILNRAILEFKLLLSFEVHIQEVLQALVDLRLWEQLENLSDAANMVLNFGKALQSDGE